MTRPVPAAMVHPIGQFAMLARIATDQPLDSHEDSCSPDSVFERVDPFRVLDRSLYSHPASVAYRLHVSTEGFRAANDS